MHVRNTRCKHTHFSWKQRRYAWTSRDHLAYIEMKERTVQVAHTDHTEVKSRVARLRKFVAPELQLFYINSQVVS